MHSIPTLAIQQNPIIYNSKIADHKRPTKFIDSKQQLFLKQEATLNTISSKICTTFCNNKIPSIKLSDGTIVANYSKDTEFASRMEQMTLDHAESIRTQINKYPNEFPMPCMAITANKIQTSLHQLKQQFCLTATEKHILNQLEAELNALSPQYPYKQSLIVTYKYLMYKSFFEFRFHLEAFIINIKDPLELQKIYLPGEENDEIMEVLEYLNSNSTSKLISSIFFSECSLSKIKNLPWDLLLDKNLSFLKELSKIYFSLGVNRTLNSAFFALSSNEILIPYANELNITFFNKTWCLPLWLVGCSLDKDLIIADGFYMGSSAFFEHDLFHLSNKLLNVSNKLPFFSYIAEQIKLIYQNNQFIKNIKFEAIELAIFYIFHERGMNSFKNNLKTIIEDSSEISDFLPMYSLPAEYELVSSIDMKNSFHFLIELFTNNNTNADFISSLLIAEKNTLAKHLLDIETGLQQVYYDINYENPGFIDETINDIISNKKILAENNFNVSRLVSIMRIYTEKMQDKIKRKSLDSTIYLQHQALDKQVLYQLTTDKRSLDWLVCFSESDKTLTSSERCKTVCQMLQKGLIICL